MERKLRPLLCVLFATSAFCPAAITITMQEVGSNVVATLSGSINSLSGATYSQTGGTSLNNALRSSGTVPHFQFTPSPGILTMNQYTITVRPANFGSGNTNFQIADSSTASTSMQFRTTANDNLVIDPGYVLGTAVTGALTWNNKTFSSMGVTPGNYVWSWTGDSVTLNVVPEPSAFSLMVLGVGGLAMLRRRRGRLSE